ncbi:hypothetical protein PLICRDRAFT_32735 [Plicaturopsis crispa FD-325 SS-3]|uniref:Uncharacterized protein n=1 Tax=Plicaturopsis crispa FD-325 SS-3 TaxID=944288 RepID=A0A0C9T3C4_PLICR|nr:hypothetical protein PLICRDRAFT_32735 [Plicaturopsis crispa FD-325 SS-3]
MSHPPTYNGPAGAPPAPTAAPAPPPAQPYDHQSYPAAPPMNQPYDAPSYAQPQPPPMPYGQYPPYWNMQWPPAHPGAFPGGTPTPTPYYGGAAYGYYPNAPSVPAPPATTPAADTVMCEQSPPPGRGIADSTHATEAALLDAARNSRGRPAETSATAALEERIREQEARMAAYEESRTRILAERDAAIARARQLDDRVLELSSRIDRLEDDALRSHRPAPYPPHTPAHRAPSLPRPSDRAPSPPRAASTSRPSEAGPTRTSSSYRAPDTGRTGSSYRPTDQRWSKPAGDDGWQTATHKRDKKGKGREREYDHYSPPPRRSPPPHPPTHSAAPPPPAARLPQTASTAGPSAGPAAPTFPMSSKQRERMAGAAQRGSNPYGSDDDNDDDSGSHSSDDERKMSSAQKERSRHDGAQWRKNSKGPSPKAIMPSNSNLGPWAGYPMLVEQDAQNLYECADEGDAAARLLYNYYRAVIQDSSNPRNAALKWVARRTLAGNGTSRRARDARARTERRQRESSDHPPSMPPDEDTRMGGDETDGAVPMDQDADPAPAPTPPATTAVDVRALNAGQLHGYYSNVSPADWPLGLRAEPDLPPLPRAPGNRLNPRIADVNAIHILRGLSPPGSHSGTNDQAFQHAQFRQLSVNLFSIPGLFSRIATIGQYNWSAQPPRTYPFSVHNATFAHVVFWFSMHGVWDGLPLLAQVESFALSRRNERAGRATDDHSPFADFPQNVEAALESLRGVDISDAAMRAEFMVWLPPNLMTPAVAALPSTSAQPAPPFTPSSDQIAEQTALAASIPAPPSTDGSHTTPPPSPR